MIRSLAAWVGRPLARGIAISAEEPAVESRDAIVILGAPLTPAGALSQVLEERLAVGLTLWRAGGGPRVIVTGGATRPGVRAEAVVMAEMAIAAGIDRDAIVIEDRAVSTADNARQVRRIAPAVGRVWLATQRFHSRRAIRCFAQVGIDARVAWWRDGLERDPVRALRWNAREYAAWLRALTRR